MEPSVNGWKADGIGRVAEEGGGATLQESDLEKEGGEG